MRRNRRRGTRPLERLRSLAASLARGFVLPLAVGGVLVIAVQWASGHPYFRLRAIFVEGARSPEGVAEWTGIEPGASLWWIDPRQTELRLLGHPRIRAAEVRREFPNRLRVAVEERSPVAVLLFDDPMLVDGEGRVFPPLAAERYQDLPCVTGFRPDDLTERPAWATARLRQAAELLRLWRRHPDWPAVSEVRPDPAGEWIVHPERVPITIRFGREIAEEQFARLSAVLEMWRGRESEVAVIDLTVSGQAVLRLRPGAERPDRRMRI